MTVSDQLKQLGQRVSQVRESVHTEEATKTALILPFLQALGYDVFNPAEVVPEYTADVGTKRGEKVDYVINIGGDPSILIECKPCGAKLDSYSSQLFRYFSVLPARIAILTDGVVYRIYSDLSASNKLDERPFLTVDLENSPPEAIEELATLGKNNFELEQLLATAEDLKYTTAVRQRIAELFDAPTDPLVRLLVDPVYEGRMTQGVIQRFRPIVENAFRDQISQRVDARLRSALSRNADSPGEDADRAEMSDDPAVIAAEKSKEPVVATTVEELQGFYIVKAIIGDMVEAKRVIARDVQSYFGVLLDDNNRKPICRLWFNASQRYLGVFDANKEETRIPIAEPESLFAHAEEIRSSLSYVLGK